MLVFRQLFDPTSSTYTYLLGDSASGEAVLIDPVFEQVRRDGALIAELGLKLLWSLDTHVHADHVTGAWLLKNRLGSQIALAAASGALGADLLLQDGDRVSFGKRSLEVRATPGHTGGCVTYVLDDESMAFTGECDYAGYMKNLDLPHPKKLDEAVPANLRCGQPGNGAAALDDPSWAPLRFTFSGVWEVEPHWLEENLSTVRVVDVREPNEFSGPLGHIRGATLVPLGELAAKAKELPT